MAMIETWLRQNLRQPVVVHRLDGNLFSGDNQGNKIGVIVTDNNETVDLDDSCFGYFIRSDGATIPIEGTASGNTAYVVLPASCYVCIGQFSFVLKVGTTTLAACTGYIYRTSTDTIVDPGSVVPSLSELLDKISDCETATAEAENVNISHTKVGPVITITTTDRDGQTEESTIREPTISVTKHGTEDPVPSREGDFDITVISSNGTEVVTNTVTIPNPNAELSDRAHVGSISRSKTRTGNPIQIEDAVNEIADKTVIKLVPKQDLHGYSRPWVGGAGKNKLDETSPMRGCYTQGGVFLTDGTYPQNYISYKLTLPAGTYTFSTDLADCFVVRYFISDVRTEVQRATQTVSFTLSAEAEVRFSLRNTSTSSIASVTPNSMIEVGSTATAFEPFANLCPISGYDTVNTIVAEENFPLPSLRNGTLSGVGEISETAAYKDIRVSSSAKIPLKAGTYKLSAFGAEQGWVYTFNSSGNNGTLYNQTVANLPMTFTLANDGMINFIVKHTDDSTLSKDNVHVFVTKEATVYPIAVSLATNGNQTAGTVYSGTVTLLADGSGQVDVNKAKVTVDNSSAIVKHNTLPVFGFNVGSAISVDMATNEAITSLYERDTAQNINTRANGTFYTFNAAFNGTTGNWITWRDDRFTTAEEMKAGLASNPLEIVAKTSSVATFTLTANQVQTLLGYNYIYTDGTEIALTYRQESLATNETLLKLLPTGTATGNPVTFSDGADGVPLKQLVVNVEPKQEGTGDPTPSNVRPISGWNKVDVIRANGTDSEEEGYEEKTYSISIPSEAGTVYGCQIVLDENGEGTLTVTHGIVDLGSLTYTYDSQYSRFISTSNLPVTIATRTLKCICSAYRCIYSGQDISSIVNGDFYLSAQKVVIHDNSTTDASAFKTSVAGQMMVYPLATPITYSLTADQVKTLLGTNIISSDAGTVEVTYFADINARINGILSQINDGTGVSF